MAEKKLMLFLDVQPKYTPKTPNRHSKLQVLGELKPDLFKRAVTSAFNRTSATGGTRVLYSGYIVNKTPVLVAKLYKATRDNVTPRGFKMFTYFGVPDGERLRVKSGLPKTFDTSKNAYPSKPPLPKGGVSKLLKIAKIAN